MKLSEESIELILTALPILTGGAAIASFVYSVRENYDGPVRSPSLE